jgi:hypothetical protein
MSVRLTQRFDAENQHPVAQGCSLIDASKVGC